MNERGKEPKREHMMHEEASTLHEPRSCITAAAARQYADVVLGFRLQKGEIAAAQGFAEPASACRLRLPRDNSPPALASSKYPQR